MIWILGLGLAVIVGWLLEREVYFYEGVQAWLYDRWAKKYDAAKHESQQHDREMLADLLWKALEHAGEPFILDFATGTGRLSSALLGHPDFRGHILALDLSQGMLEEAAEKLSRPSRPLSVEFLRHVSLPLPFPDAAFDVVCALEVLELFPRMEAPLAEFRRVLRPGGLLLTSRGTERSGRKARVKSKSDFGLLLTNYDFEKVHILPWWNLFDRVIALKQGSSHPVGARRLTDVLRCRRCGQTRWRGEGSRLRCGSCGETLSRTKDGIVLN